MTGLANAKNAGCAQFAGASEMISEFNGSGNRLMGCWAVTAAEALDTRDLDG
jgi:hypothetical protein